MDSVQSRPTHQMIRLTPSMVDTWHECPRRFAEQQRNKNKYQCRSKYSPKLAMGKAIHDLFAQVNRQLIGGGVFPDIEEALEQFWNASYFRMPEEACDAKSTATTMLANYFGHLQSQHLTVLAFERFVTTRPLRINGHVAIIFIAKIDAITQGKDGRVFVDDYKTTDVLPTRGALASRLSSTIYHLLTRQLQPEAACIAIRQMLPATGAVVTVALTDNQVRVSKERIKALALAMTDDPLWVGEAFQPTDGEYCSWCPYRNTCPLHMAGIDFAEELF